MTRSIIVLIPVVFLGMYYIKLAQNQQLCGSVDKIEYMCNLCVNWQYQSRDRYICLHAMG